LSGHATRWSKWLQVAIGLSIVAAIAAGIYYESTAKAEDTLYIELGQLRSRAAEVTRVADGAAARRLTGTYIEAQARQLEKAVAKLAGELAQTRASVHTADATRAGALAEALLALTRTLIERGESPGEAATVRDRGRAIVDALIPMERTARPS
jgi:hypothetical protein